jgi:hypothetical protein
VINQIVRRIFLKGNADMNRVPPPVILSRADDEGSLTISAQAALCETEGK